MATNLDFSRFGEPVEAAIPAGPKAGGALDFSGAAEPIDIGGAEPVAEAPDEPGAISRGFVTGLLKQNPEMMAETFEGLSHLAPEDFRETFGEGAKEFRALAGKSPADYKPRAGSMWDVKSLDEALTWAGETFGQGAASTVPSLVTGVGGALAGSRVAGRTGGRVGAVAGALVPSAALNYGEVYKAIKDEKVDPKLAAEYAAYATGPMATLDFASIGPVISRLGGLDTVRREVARSIARRIAAETAKGSGREGLTEAMQEAVKEAAVSLAADKPFWTAETGKKVGEAFVGGALVGGPMGAAGGIVPDRSPPPDLPVPQMQGAPPGAVPAEAIIGTEQPPAAPAPAAAQPQPAAPLDFSAQAEPVDAPAVAESDPFADLIPAAQPAPDAQLAPPPAVEPSAEVARPEPAQPAGEAIPQPLPETPAVPPVASPAVEPGVGPAAVPSPSPAAPSIERATAAQPAQEAAPPPRQPEPAPTEPLPEPAVDIAAFIEPARALVKDGKTPLNPVAVAKNLGTDERTARRILNDLVAKGIIRSVSTSKAYDRLVKRRAEIAGSKAKIKNRKKILADHDAKIAKLAATLRYARHPKRGPMTLSQFLASKGGIRDDGGELRAMGLDSRKGFQPGYGPLVSSTGMTLDGAREAAVEAGYLGTQAGRYDPDNPTPDTMPAFMEAIRRDNEKGRERVRTEDDTTDQDRQADIAADEDRARQEQAEAEAERVIAAAGARFDDAERAQLVRAIREGTDPADAIMDIAERAALQSVAEIAPDADTEAVPFDAPDRAGAQAAPDGAQPEGEARDPEGSVPRGVESGEGGGVQGQEAGGEEGKVDGQAEPRHSRGINSGYRAAARQILSAIETDPLADYGLRVIYGEDAPDIAIGDRLPNSHVWADGEQTDEELPGTSAISIQSADFESVVSALERLGAHGKLGPNGYYPGDLVLLVSGDNQGHGEDAGEVIFGDARVVGIWRKPDEGNSEVLPNNAPPRQEGARGEEGRVAPLYVNRPVTNAADIIAWAASQGFKTTLPAGEIHVTVAYSKEPVSWSAAGDAEPSVRATGGKRTVEKLGDKGAVVLRFEAAALSRRWQEYRDAGASWDFPGYKPHVTITYDGGDMDLSKVQPYGGPINFGPEQQEPLDEDATDKIKEAAPKPAIDQTDQGAQRVLTGTERGTKDAAKEAARTREQEMLRLRGQQSKMRRGGQERVENAEGGLFGGTGDMLDRKGDKDDGQGGMFSLRRPQTETAGETVVTEPVGDIGEVRFVYSDEFRAERQKVWQALRVELDRLGLGDIALRISDRIEATIKVDGEPTEMGADGRYLRSIIDVALDSRDPLRVLTHEAIHALRELGVLTKAEWTILNRAAEKTWRKRFDIESRYEFLDRDRQNEEAIADAASAWKAGDLKIGGIIGRAFAKIGRFLRALGNALRGNGFQTWEDVFERIDSGEAGNRPRRGEQDAQGQPRYSAGMDGKEKPPDRGARSDAGPVGAGESRQEPPTEGGEGIQAQTPLEFNFDESAVKGIIPNPERFDGATRVDDPAVIAALGQEFRSRGWLRDDGSLSKGGRNWIVRELKEHNNSLIRKARERAERRYLKEVGRDYAAVLKRAHKNRELTFRSLPVEAYNRAIKITLHKSASYNRQQSSEYQLMLVDGEPVYARKSNHWGRFWVNIREGDPDAPAGVEGDQFGRVGSRSYNWELADGQRRADGKYANTSQAGYIRLADLVHRAEPLRASAPSVRDVTVEAKFSLRPNTPLTTENRQKAMQGMLAKGQPIDRALRLPFDWFGGVDAKGEWQPGAKLYDKAKDIILTAKVNPDGRFGWLAGPMAAARAGLIDRYGLSEEYVQRERRLDLDKREIALRGAEVLKSLKEQNIGVEEARVLQAVLTGEEVADADMAKIALPIRQEIDRLGQEAVSLGLVSPESFNRNRATYLHRVYMKHEADQHQLGRWFSSFMTSKRKKIVGDAFRGRGMFLDVEGDRVMQDIAEFREGARGLPVKGERFVILDRYADQVEMEGLGKVPRAERRVFWPADKPIPDRFKDFTDNGTWEVRAAGGKRVTLWRDFTKAERERMGEILDARYTIGKTFTLMAQDLATGRFYRDIAQNNEWTRNQQPNGKWVNAQDFRRLWNDETVEWVKVPDVDIPNSGGKKRWGALAGKYVRAEIWRDLNEIDIASRPTTWTTLLNQWKLNKTARSPVVHTNNILSNMMFMDMADVRLQDLVRGIRAYVNETADYREAADNGAFGSDLISQEIKKNILQPILDDLQKEMAGGKNPLLAKFGALGRIADAIWQSGRAFDEKMMDLYRVEDEVFRMAMYMRRRSLGDSAENAAAEARQQFLDYDIRAPWVNAARRSVLPFIAYTYRAVPVIARSIAVRPWKLAKYFAIAYAANALAYMIAPGDEDDERRSMREQEQGFTWIGVPRMLRMPYRDEHGNPVFLDIRRWIPAGDVFDIAQGHGVFSLPAPLGFGGPLMLAMELYFNKSAFTGREIVNDLTASPTDRVKAGADHLWKSWLPSAAWVPGSWYWDKIGLALDGATDTAGNAYSLPEAAASSIGIKLKGQDVAENEKWRAFEFDKARRALRAEERRLGRLRDRNVISQESYDEALENIAKKRDRLATDEEKVFPPKK